MATSTDHRGRFAAACVAALFGALYLAHAAAGPVVGDGPELAIAAHTLGVPHPSGYPLFTLVSRSASLAGDPTRSLHILNALFAALAVGLVTLLAAKSRGTGPAVLAGLMLGGSATLVREATRFEVYTFWLLLLALLLLLSRSRSLLLFYVAGLACAHHLAILFLAPAILIGAWPALTKLRRRPAQLALGVFLFAIGASVYLYLPVRAALGPAWNWGDPSTFDRLLIHVTGRGYWGYAGGGGANDLLAFLGNFPREVSWAGILLVPLGFLALIREGRGRQCAMIGLGIAGIAFYIGRYGVNDPEPYFIPIVLFASLLVAEGAAFLGERVGHFSPLLHLAVGVVLLAQAATNARTLDRSGSGVLPGYVAAILQTVADGGALVVEGDAETFGLFHAQIIDHERTDVTVYNFLFDLGPEGPILARERDRGPGWKRRALATALRAGTPTYTAVEQDMFSEPGFVLRPCGLLYRWQREGTSPADEDALWNEYDLGFADRVDRNAEFLERWIAAHVWTQSARHAMRSGARESGRALLRRAEEIGGGSAAIYLNVGRAYREAGDIDEALRLFREAASHATDGLVEWNEADLLIARERDPERADSLLLAVIERDSRRRYPATLRRGRLALEQGRFMDARQRFAEAAQLRPADVAPQRGLWEAAVLLGDTVAASRARAELDRLAPGGLEDRVRDEATFFDRAGNARAADSLYALMLHAENDDPYDWNAAAWNQALRDSVPASALSWVDRGLALAPNDPYLLDTKGWILHRSGRNAEAAELMDRALLDDFLPGAGPRWRRAIVARALGDARGEERWASDAETWSEDLRWRLRYEEAAGGL